MSPSLPPLAGSPSAWWRPTWLRGVVSSGGWMLVLGALAWGGLSLRTLQRQQELAEDVPDSALRRRMLAIEEWVGLGEAAVPVLRTSLLSGQPRRQSDAAAAATRLGPAAQVLRPELLACLDSDDVLVREQALAALLALPEGQTDLLPRLARLLGDPAFALRSLAARGLDRATASELDQALASVAPPPAPPVPATSAPTTPETVPTAVTANPAARAPGPSGNLPVDLLRLARWRHNATLDHEQQAALRRWLRDTRLDDLLRAESLELLIWHDAVELDDLLAGLAQRGPELGGLSLRRVELWGPRAVAAAPLLARLLE
ncbi:MAG: hypothetical protein ACKOJF_22180, partial [Planctomycetaceae bacterium]